MRKEIESIKDYKAFGHQKMRRNPAYNGMKNEIISIKKYKPLHIIAQGRKK